MKKNNKIIKLTMALIVVIYIVILAIILINIKKHTKFNIEDVAKNNETELESKNNFSNSSLAENDILSDEETKNNSNADTNLSEPNDKYNNIEKTEVANTGNNVGNTEVANTGNNVGNTEVANTEDNIKNQEVTNTEVNTKKQGVANTEENVGNIGETNKESQVNENNTNVKTRNFGNDVAFIGDSRTQAFIMYAGLSKVIDYTNIGLMVDTAVSKKFITNSNGEKITILEDLKNKDINTIYIMLGINELGWVYSSIFINKYEELINKILEIKPNCEIIIQSIIPVTKTKSDNDKIYNNNKIKEYNRLIEDMAKRLNIKYINLVPALTNENGDLPENASTDGIHLNKNYCKKWLEVLENN